MQKHNSHAQIVKDFQAIFILEVARVVESNLKISFHT